MTAPGSKPPLKTMPLRSAPPVAADVGPMLIVVEGLEPGRRFALVADTTLVGRGGDNHVVLPSPAVSAAHARIVARDGQFFLEDLDSTNGVAVNGHRLVAGEPRLLANGDSVRVSDHLLFFHRGGAQQFDLAATIAVDHDAAAKQADELLEQLRRRDAGNGG
jgi:pSer/pThr/pTyr-binding forkhead associated (FHA) protein